MEAGLSLQFKDRIPKLQEMKKMNLFFRKMLFTQIMAEWLCCDSSSLLYSCSTKVTSSTPDEYLSLSDFSSATKWCAQLNKSTSIYQDG